MLLLAYLMTRTEAWDGAKIRVLAANNEDRPEQTAEDLRTTLNDIRIEAEPVVIQGGADGLLAQSANSAVVYVPFRLRGNQVIDYFGGALGEIISRLPVVAAVLGAEDIDLDAEPEEGVAGERAKERNDREAS